MQMDDVLKVAQANGLNNSNTPITLRQYDTVTVFAVQVQQRTQ